MRNLLGKQAAANCRLWVRAPRLPLNRWGHGPTGRCQHRTLEIRVRLPVTPLERHGPVVQRHDTWPTPRKRWFDSIRDHFGPDTPTGRAARLKPECLRVRLPLWALRLGRQPADHLGLEPGMLWVRLPPEPLERLRTINGLVEQPGVLACLSRRRSRVQIPSRALGKWRGTQIGKAAQAQTFVSAGSTPAFAT